MTTNTAHSETYKTMSADRLREVYWHWRQAEHSGFQMRYAKGMRNIQDRLEMIERIADKRGISLKQVAG